LLLLSVWWCNGEDARPQPSIAGTAVKQEQALQQQPALAQLLLLLLAMVSEQLLLASKPCFDDCNALLQTGWPCVAIFKDQLWLDE
jgi:hypothetical protein